MAKPSSVNGVYQIALNPTAEPFPVMCDMSRGGWTLVYKISGHSAMMSTEAVDANLLGHVKYGAIQSKFSAKLSDDAIRSLCSEQYAVEQHGSKFTVNGTSVPHRIYCAFDDTEAYGDNKKYVGKRCDSQYNKDGVYPKVSGLVPPWSSGVTSLRVAFACTHTR